MRAQLSKEALALVSAALRHARDAEHLADTTSPYQSLDQAFHLAGFGPECARKATLSSRWSDKPLGHELGKKGDRVLDFVLGLDPAARRYNPLDWASRYPALHKWDPECRYETTGHRSAKADATVAEARRAVDEIVSALWADGRLPDGALP
jgi:hypothetical protein